jgi:hypothetical protein
MARKSFCCVENFSVLIPYKDLEKLLETAYKLEEFQMRLKRMEEKQDALRVMYTEALMKIREIEKYL